MNFYIIWLEIGGIGSYRPKSVINVNTTICDVPDLVIHCTLIPVYSHISLVSVPSIHDSTRLGDGMNSFTCTLRSLSILDLDFGVEIGLL